MSGLVPLIATFWLVACSSSPCEDADCDSGEVLAEECDVAVNAVTQDEVADTPQVRDLTVSLTSAADLAVTCQRGAADPEVHLWESPESQEHGVLLAGLLAETNYQCEATPICGDLKGTARSFKVEIGQRLGSFPSVNVVGDIGQSFVLVNHARFCDDQQPLRLLVFDAVGQIRWSYAGFPLEVKMSIGHQYLGNGEFFWGGGETELGDPSFVDLRQETLDQVAYPGSEMLVWHHEARVYPDGQVLSMVETTNTYGSNAWKGFGLDLFDPVTEEVTWSYSSQAGVDQGVLDASSTGDPYHANWATVDGEAGLAYVSLCEAEQVIAIDMSTGQIVWSFGKGGDFALVDASGASLPDDDFPQCQHGLEMRDNTLLVFDNGQTREESRVTEFTLDVDTWTATRNWTWTEEDFYELSLGDVDYLDDGTVLVGRGHVDCLDGIQGAFSEVSNLDPESGETPWRMTFTDSEDVIYRAGLIDICDVFGSSLYCPEVAERLEVLGL